jgi:hypothetical protein
VLVTAVRVMDAAKLVRVHGRVATLFEKKYSRVSSARFDWGCKGDVGGTERTKTKKMHPFL